MQSAIDQQQEGVAVKLIAVIRNGGPDGETNQIESEADSYLSAFHSLWAQVPVGWVMLFVQQK